MKSAVTQVDCGVSPVALAASLISVEKQRFFCLLLCAEDSQGLWWGDIIESEITHLNLLSASPLYSLH